uniref:Uncharacterized protein n=1 Tax=Arundo donax TaxID=35708 RepID=A0A0A9CAX4_ARUDO
MTKMEVHFTSDSTAVSSFIIPRPLNY